MLTPGLHAVEPELRRIVQSEVRDGERLVWASQAVPRYLDGPTTGVVLFAIPWTAFSIFWTASAFFGTRDERRGDGSITGFGYGFPLFGVPFILIGLAMFTTPYWTARRLRRTVYAVTDRRAIAFTPGPFGSRKVRSFSPAALASIERTERPDGSGDLVFEEYTERRGSSTQTIRHGFFSVPRVREVEDVLRKTLVAERVKGV